MKLGIYQHYKGNLYKVKCIGRHTETDEELVVYEPINCDEDSEIWVRPLKMFLEKVRVDGIEVPRFRHVGELKAKERL